MSDQIRAAASVIAVRAGAGEPEILVLERSPQSRFLPGYVAFPGGAADRDDPQLAGAWFGSPNEAARACAVRELVEEVGLALTAAGLVEGRDLEVISASPPSIDQLVPLARWIAPEEVPVRFDARYFVVGAPGDLVPIVDGEEAVDAWWISPRELLRQWEKGQRKLYWPTWFTIQALARAETAEELLGLQLRTREPDEHELAHLPRSVFWEE